MPNPELICKDYKIYLPSSGPALPWRFARDAYEVRETFIPNIKHGRLYLCLNAYTENGIRLIATTGDKKEILEITYTVNSNFPQFEKAIKAITQENGLIPSGDGVVASIRRMGHAAVLMVKATNALGITTELQLPVSKEQAKTLGRYCLAKDYKIEHYIPIMNDGAGDRIGPARLTDAYGHPLTALIEVHLGQSWLNHLRRWLKRPEKPIGIVMRLEAMEMRGVTLPEWCRAQTRKEITGRGYRPDKLAYAIDREPVRKIFRQRALKNLPPIAAKPPWLKPIIR
jgi:hypothetical protein